MSKFSDVLGLAGVLVGIAGCGSPRIPLSLEYHLPESRPVAGEIFTIGHSVSNCSGRTVTVCTMPENVDFRWTVSVPADPDSGPEDLPDIRSDTWAHILHGVIGCHATPADFKTIDPSESLELREDVSIPIPADGTQLVYRAWFSPIRDGKRLGLRAWTGRVQGREIRLKVGPAEHEHGTAAVGCGPGVEKGDSPENPFEGITMHVGPGDGCFFCRTKGLPIQLTPEQDALLVREGVLPPLEAEANDPARRRESWLVTGTESIVPVTAAKADEPALVSIELNAVPLSDVLRMFSGIGKAGDFSRYSHIHVTGSYTNVPWQDALGQILSEHGLKLVEGKPGSGILKVAPRTDDHEEGRGVR